jgi:hypothetical protein
MGLNSTPFLSYHEIQIDEIDIYDDAWGFNSEFSDVINLLSLVKPVPEKRLTKRLIERVRQKD